MCQKKKSREFLSLKITSGYIEIRLKYTINVERKHYNNYDDQRSNKHNCILSGHKRDLYIYRPIKLCLHHAVHAILGPSHFPL